MRELTVELGDRSYPILVGAGLLADCEALAALAAGRGVAVVTDSNVAALHGRRVADALRRHAAAEGVTVADAHAAILRAALLPVTTA